MIKKLFILSLLFVSLPVYAATFNKDLSYGMTGNADVITLQTQLTQEGFYTGPVSGNFFGLTRQAVAKYQSAHNLPTTGYVGPKTRAELAKGFSKIVQTSQTTQTSQKQTFTTPGGTVIDQNGNVISAPSNTTAVTVDDKAIGQAYFDSKNTCIGLSGIQYTSCVTYAFGKAANTSIQNPTTSASQSAPTSQARIDIISPIAGKGLGPRLDPTTGVDLGYVSSPTVQNESNYIVLGAILYNDDGSVNNTATMTITATDSTQNKVLQGTGDVMKIYPNGELRQVYGYTYSYDFHTSGQHTITFSANGIQKSVTVMVK